MRRASCSVLRAAATCAVVGAAGVLLGAGAAVQTIDATGGLPASMAARIRKPLSYIELTGGEQVVLDGDTRGVFLIDGPRTTAKRLAGVEAAEALTGGPEDTFAVVDAPKNMERVQFFYRDGTQIGAFIAPPHPAPRIAIDGVTLSGIGSLQFLGPSVLVNAPELGALITELDQDGHAIRHIGTLRHASDDADADLRLGLNLGLPLVDPTGGVYFVFQTGVPMFQKYDAHGVLLFERHIEGAELDATIQQLPTTWPRRARGEWPVVPATVRTAAVDAHGHLWVSLAAPVTYEYDETGDKLRTVRFRAGDTIAPRSLFFASHDRLLVTPGCREFRGSDPFSTDPAQLGTEVDAPGQPDLCPQLGRICGKGV